MRAAVAVGCPSPPVTGYAGAPKRLACTSFQ
jgi:hypothetical protein